MQRWMLALLLAISAPLHAQDLGNPQEQETDHAVAAPPADHAEVVNTRVFGVLPNYRTTDGRVEFSPITNRQKLAIAAKDSFDWPVYFTTGAYALIYQAENQNPEFGQGLKGYAKRYGATYGDMAIGNMVAEASCPFSFMKIPAIFAAVKARPVPESAAR